jgi:hypothetical protein
MKDKIRFNNKVVHGLYITKDHSKFWFKDGFRHREHNCAVEYDNAEKDKYYYYNGEEISCDSLEEFERLIRLSILW